MTGAAVAARQRVGRAAAAVGSPAGAVLALRMLGWSLALPALKSALPLQTLVRLMSREQRPAARDAAAEQRIVTLSRVVHRGVGLGRRDNCLERSLVAFRYLAAAQAQPSLVIGARAGDSAVEGHVWTTLDGVAVHDDAEALGRFVEVTAFRADGRRVDVPATPPR